MRIVGRHIRSLYPPLLTIDLFYIIPFLIPLLTIFLLFIFKRVCRNGAKRTIRAKKNWQMELWDMNYSPLFTAIPPLFPRYSFAIFPLFPCYSFAISPLFPLYLSLFPRYSLAIYRYSLAIPPPLFAGHVHNFIPQNESMQQVHFMIKSFSTYSKKMIWILK